MNSLSFGHMINPCPQPSLFPCFPRPCTVCDPWNCPRPCPPPCPPPCPDTCNLVCARRLSPCERPCCCGCPDLSDLKGIQISVCDVDCCGNLILRVQRPRECCVNGQPVKCRKYY